MKNFILKISVFVLAFAPIIGLQSCSNTNSKDSQEMAEDQNKENKDVMTEPAQDDAKFVTDVAEISLEEIQLGQQAQKMAMMDSTKQLATMLVNDHKAGYDQLSALAKNKNITIPTSINADAQKDLTDFAGKKSEDYDKDYCDKMVSDHKDAIDKFEKEANNGSDPDIKQWAASTLPTLRAHLNAATRCQEECKRMKDHKM